MSVIGLNIVLTLLMIIGLLAIIGVIYLVQKNRKFAENEVPEKDFEYIVNICRERKIEGLKDQGLLGLSQQEYEKNYHRKRDFKNANEQSIHGFYGGKVTVKDFFEQIIRDELSTIEEIEKIVNWKSLLLSSEIKSEIILYFWEKKYGKEAFIQLAKEYDWGRQRFDEDGEPENFYVDEDDLDEAYQDLPDPTLEDLYKILSTLVYQRLNGFGVIDTFHHLSMDGYSIGVSGSVLGGARASGGGTMLSLTRSFWVYLGGKEVHLRYIDFKSSMEMKRIITLLIRYRSPGSFDEARGFIITTNAHGERVVAIRPGASESYACFVRKFGDLSKVSVESYITNRGSPLAKDVKGMDIVLNLIKLLMEATITVVVTGAQGSGKTTLMKGMVATIPPEMTLRIIEATPELRAREAYPQRNILSMSETSTITMMMLQDLSKKTNGHVILVGEISDDRIAERFIQAATVGSVFTVGTHHATSAYGLIKAFAAHLAAAGGGGSTQQFERNVLDVLHVNIHCAYSPAVGFRYIDRITEIIPYPLSIPYPVTSEENEAEALVSLATNFKEFAKRSTDREMFSVQDIIKYDPDAKEYKVVSWFSKQKSNQIFDNLRNAERRAYWYDWYQEHWVKGR